MNAISNSGWTLPAMASLFTGKLVSHHGTSDHYQYLNDDQPTLAEVLGENGYETIGFSENSFVSNFTGLNRGFKTFHELSFSELSLNGKLLKLLKYLRKKWHRIRGIPEKYCHTLIQMYEMRQWIKKVGKQQQPFFLYMHANQTHYPFLPAKRFRKKFIDKGLKECLRVNQDREKYVAGEVSMKDEDFKVLKALYDAELNYFDNELGKFFDFLKSSELFDNTMIIITADHGENFGRHNLIGHGLCLYDDVLKIPLIIRYPKAFDCQKINQQVQLSDIFPTILDILKIDKEQYSETYWGSIKKMSDDESFEEDRIAIFEQGCPTMDIFHKKIKKLDLEFLKSYQCSMHGIRTKDYKFIWSSNGLNELYDLREDPSELKNLIDVLPEKAKELQNQLFNVANKFQTDEPVLSLTDTKDKEVAKRLKGLGYM